MTLRLRQSGNRGWGVLVLVLSLIGSVTSTLQGQGLKTDKHYLLDYSKWSIELPLWVPGFRGQLAYGELDLESGSRDDRKGSLFENDIDLEFYFVGRASYLHNHMWFQFDAFAGQVGSVFKFVPAIGAPENELIDVSIRGVIPRLLGGYVLYQSKESELGIKVIPYAGVRYVGLRITSNETSTADPLDLSPKWAEGVIGVYVPIYYRRFKFETQVDYGIGGSKNSWILSNRLNYRLSKLLDLQLGWNFIGLSHNDTIDGDNLNARIRLVGPSAGIGFWF